MVLNEVLIICRGSELIGPEGSLAVGRSRTGVARNVTIQLQACISILRFIGSS